MKQTLRDFLKTVIAIDLMTVLSISCGQGCRQTDFVELEHRFHLMNREISKGWNSYDTRSLFTQVYLPECFGIQLSLLDKDGNEVNDLRVGNKRDHAQGFDPAWQKDAAYVRPWNHTYDGTYSEVDATWHGVSVELRCAAEKDTLVMLVTPLEGNVRGNGLKIIPCLNWDCINLITSGDDVYFRERDFSFGISFSDWMLDGYIDAENLKATLLKEESGQWDYYTCSLDSPVVISVGKKVSVREAEALMEMRRNQMEQEGRSTYGDKQVGFVPKFTADHKNITDDCSQPPVGAFSVWRIYEKYGEKWLM